MSLECRIATEGLSGGWLRVIVMQMGYMAGLGRSERKQSDPTVG